MATSTKKPTTTKKNTTTKTSAKSTTKKTAKAIDETKNTNTKKNVETNNDTKVFKILSYFGILWIISLFVPCKNDKSVKFHAGQGMLLFIVEVVINIIWNIINNLIIKNIFRVEHTIFGYGTGQYYVSTVGVIISTTITLAISAIYIYFMVIGIINVIKDKDEKLPYIGKYAFYK